MNRFLHNPTLATFTTLQVMVTVPWLGRKHRGQGLAEWTMATALIVLAVVGIVTQFPQILNDWFTAFLGGTPGLSPTYGGG